jgi:hypothetical protein
MRVLIIGNQKIIATKRLIGICLHNLTNVQIPGDPYLLCWGNHDGYISTLGSLTDRDHHKPGFGFHKVP